MYKILKFLWKEKDRHYFTSDWHAFHDPKWEVPIWEARGYLNAQDSAERILDKINSRVGPDDYLWMLGDPFLNATDAMVLNWLKSVKCRNIKMLQGNHESQMFRIYRNEVLRQYNIPNVEIYPLTMDNVEFLGNHQEIYIGKQNIILNHFPLHSWHSNNRGSWMLHGHSHNNDKSRNPDYPYGKSIDCSWDWKNDVWAFAEIEDVMSTKDIVVTDHH